MYSANSYVTLNDQTLNHGKWKGFTDEILFTPSKHDNIWVDDTCIHMKTFD
jgi:hypothetical protein